MFSMKLIELHNTQHGRAVEAHYLVLMIIPHKVVRCWRFCKQTSPPKKVIRHLIQELLSHIQIKLVDMRCMVLSPIRRRLEEMDYTAQVVLLIHPCMSVTWHKGWLEYDINSPAPLVVWTRTGEEFFQAPYSVWEEIEQHMIC